MRWRQKEEIAGTVGLTSPPTLKPARPPPGRSTPARAADTQDGTPQAAGRRTGHEIQTVLPPSRGPAARKQTGPARPDSRSDRAFRWRQRLQIKAAPLRPARVLTISRGLSFECRGSGGSRVASVRGAGWRARALRAGASRRADRGPLRHRRRSRPGAVPSSEAFLPRLRDLLARVGATDRLVLRCVETIEDGSSADPASVLTVVTSSPARTSAPTTA